MLKPLLLAGLLSAASLSAGAADFVWLSQSGGFDEAARDGFYSQDQGSRLIPYAWLQALRRADGAPFLADGLARYGYLPNPARADGLPVGFTTLEASGPTMVGMTCAACHTRQIVVEGVAYRIDGGPAIVDFQRLLTDLDTAVTALLADPTAFDAFAAAVKTTDPSTDTAALKGQVTEWLAPFHAIVAASITVAPGHIDWGFGRLDAISMIFNRVAGLDIGADGNRILSDNMKGADAPARYPFLWNAATEAKTQWPGFAPNDPLGGALGRNVGEVLGVFARFDPQGAGFAFAPYKAASVNFQGMRSLEGWAAQIPAPQWPWPIDKAKADRGEKVFATACGDCHLPEPPLLGQRQTPVKDVCTDGAEAGVLLRRIAHAGVLKGAPLFDLRFGTLADDALDVDLLRAAVIGAIVQNVFHPVSNALSEFGGLDVTLAARTGDLNAFTQTSARAASAQFAQSFTPGAALVLQAEALRRVPANLTQLNGVYAAAADPQPTFCALRKPQDPPAPYEARYLAGVWAVAPYLHDGSVATLRDLLKPAAARRPSFKIGPNYDVKDVGLAEDQPADGSSTLTTTDCSDLGSGRSRCGHEYGADLSDGDKEDLLEYLKKM